MTHDRITSGIAALLVQALLGYALVTGLNIRLPLIAEDVLTVIPLPPDAAPPPEKPIPPPERSKQTAGAAAPPNIRSTATQVVAPPPLMPIPIPPPIIAAPIANMGDQASQGAALRPGPGTGAGGMGNGTGKGGRGTGDGGGDDTPPRWLKGKLKDSDYPQSAGDSGAQGSVEVRFTVEINGRVDQCLIRRSSGNAELDATTCRLIEQRYRYRPAKDADGDPILSYVVEEHDWAIEPETPADP